MLESYPVDLDGIDKARLAACIDPCVSCAEVCSACADVCLGEDMVERVRKCIRTCLDCADICAVTGRVLSRHTGYDANLTRAMLQVCVTAWLEGRWPAPFRRTGHVGGGDERQSGRRPTRRVG
jgi:hypothetical protein